MTAAAPKTVFIEIRDIPVAELIPFPGNAKRGDVGMIRESIEEHDQYRALVVRHTPDDTFVVLAGNHTLQAIKDLKRPTARCEVIACDEMTAKKINLVDNRASDAGTYDDQALADILASLDGDFTGTGYPADFLMTVVSVPDGITDSPGAPETYQESSETRNVPQRGVQSPGTADRGTLCDHCPCRSTQE